MGKHAYTEVRGHGLAAEGLPFDSDCRRVRSGRTGHAKCACGELSPELPNTNQRQEWHREHKAAKREASNS